MTLIIVGVVAWFLGLVIFAGGGAWTASAPRYKPSTGGPVLVVLGWLLALAGLATFIIGLCLEIFS